MIYVSVIFHGEKKKRNVRSTNHITLLDFWVEYFLISFPYWYFYKLLPSKT